MLNDKDYRFRVQEGLRLEKKILVELSRQGVVIWPPTEMEDKVDKIDGWIERMGQRSSIQLKAREGGDDIIFEVLKDIRTGMKGRDLISKAEYYLVVNRNGLAQLFATPPIKVAAEQMIRAFTHQFGEKTQWRGIGWVLKITRDMSHGNQKLMAFFNPGAFESLGEWHLNLS